jgi:hypothetical protein
MKNYTYKLEPYTGPKSRFECPECRAKKSFAKYIDGDTGNHVGDNIGRCNRESKCNYHLKPKEFGISPVVNTVREFMPSTPPKPFKYIAVDAMGKSLASYGKNNLVKYLISQFGEADALALAAKYYVGTSKYKPGACIFYQIDRVQRVRRGKVMLYDPITGRRDHKIINSVHALSKLSDHKPAECFFGEHLLTESSKPVAVCESEKTAVIASYYLPGFIWLACGGLSMLNYDKCQALTGRDVTLFPDLKGYNLWQEKANLFLSKITRSWKVSNLLERVATETERNDGLDLADYLLRYSVDQINNQPERKLVDCGDLLQKNEPLTTSIPPNVLQLHAKYVEAEQRGILDNHPHREYIRALWQAVGIYAHKPTIQSHYLKSLEQITLTHDGLLKTA